MITNSILKKLVPKENWLVKVDVIQVKDEQGNPKYNDEGEPIKEVKYNYTFNRRKALEFLGYKFVASREVGKVGKVSSKDEVSSKDDPSSDLQEPIDQTMPG